MRDEARRRGGVRRSVVGFAIPGFRALDFGLFRQAWERLLQTVHEERVLLAVEEEGETEEAPVAVQRGEDVLVFPEGTRILSDDQEIEIHAGFALMAQLAKAPVLPMAIVGARDGGIGGNKPIRPGRVYMAVGDPITFDEIEAKGRKQQASEMEQRAMKAVYSLRDRLRAKHPGKM
jgi:1-acyl-sn-glycerol-3-phosphate acyltransferase